MAVAGSLGGAGGRAVESRRRNSLVQDPTPEERAELLRQMRQGHDDGFDDLAVDSDNAGLLGHEKPSATSRTPPSLAPGGVGLRHRVHAADPGDGTSSVPEAGVPPGVLATMGASTNSLAGKADSKKATSTAERLAKPPFKARLQRYMNTSYVGYLLDGFNAAISFLACMFYVVETYFEGDRDFVPAAFVGMQLELAFSVVFTMDFLLRLYLSTPPTRFLFSWSAFVDLVTIVPVAFTYQGVDIDALYEQVDNDDFDLGFFRFARVLRVLRILRVHRTFEYVNSEVQQQVYRISLTIVSTIFVTAGVFHITENALWYGKQPGPYSSEYELMPFHDAVYFVIVSVTTVGYGDVKPMSLVGKFVSVFMIMFSFVVLPMELNRLNRIIQNKSIYALSSYRNPPNCIQVMVTGVVNTASIHTFFKELLHEDHGPIETRAVVLSPERPSPVMMGLLEHPKYSDNITYLQGSPMVERDLVRARADTADGVLILTDKSATSREERDAETILTALAIKRFLYNRIGRDVYTYMQLLRPESKEHFLKTMPRHMSATIVCVEQLKMNLLATSCFCPAMTTLIYNLIASDSGTSPQEEGSWTSEYLEGLGYEVYRTSLSVDYADVDFLSAAEIVFEETHSVLFALQLSDSEDRSSRILLNPGRFRIPNLLHVSVMAFIIAQDKVSADIVGLSKTATLRPAALDQATRLRSRLLQVKASRTSRSAVVDMGASADGKADANGTSGNVGDRERGMSRESMASGPAGGISARDDDLVDSAQLIANMVGSSHENARLLAATAAGIKRLKSQYYVRDVPATLESVTIHSTSGVSGLRGHVIVTGTMHHLYHLVMPLRSRMLAHVKPILLLAPHPPTEADWFRISVFPAVYYMKGSALNSDELQRAGVVRASNAIILSREPNPELRQIEEEQDDGTVVDSEAIFCRQSIHNVAPHVEIVTELVNYDNTIFLKPDVANFMRSVDGANQTSPHFASGSVFTTAILDILMCQAFFNPAIVSLLDELVVGTESANNAHRSDTLRQRASSRNLRGLGGAGAADAESSTAMLTDEEDEPPKPLSRLDKIVAEAKLSRLKLIPLPHGMNGKTYGALVAHLTSNDDALPLGLYRSKPMPFAGKGGFDAGRARSTSRSSLSALKKKIGTRGTPRTFGSSGGSGSNRAHKSNLEPYVFTNPPKDTVCRAADQVYVLVHEANLNVTPRSLELLTRTGSRDTSRSSRGSARGSGQGAHGLLAGSGAVGRLSPAGIRASPSRGGIVTGPPITPDDGFALPGSHRELPDEEESD